LQFWQVGTIWSLHPFLKSKNICCRIFLDFLWTWFWYSMVLGWFWSNWVWIYFYFFSSTSGFGDNRPWWVDSEKMLHGITWKRGFFNPFTGDFDLPKQKWLNGLFWFFFDLAKSQKKSIFCTFWCNCSTNFAKWFESSSVLKKSLFLNVFFVLIFSCANWWPF
jgi:hypothetical protein